jgi:hypothetical protein
MLPFGSCRTCWLSVRPWKVALPYGKATFHGRTDSQQAQQEPNGSIATAQDTPDDGPVKARNM